MEFLDKIIDSIKSLEDRDFYTYAGLGFGAFFLALSLLIYVHYSKVTKYQNELKRIDVMRQKTKQILSNYKVVTAQKEKVEDILAQNKDFRIGEAYQFIVNKVGLTSRLVDQTAPTTGEVVSGKTEVLVRSHFAGLNMKQVTDLLSEIADVPQLYVKDLVIKKTPNAQTVDVDITVATLEPSTPE